MVKLINIKLLVFIVLLLLPFSYGFSQISVPDYSFVGRELTEFKVQPSYTLIKFNFSVPNQMDTYLEKKKAELEGGDKRDYSSEEPGFIYKTQSSAQFTSIFVGPKALRNNVVKSFLNKDYINTITSYEKFEKKLKLGKYKDETLFVYGMSLYYTGSHKEAFDILISLVDENNEYGQLAQDAVFNITSESKKYDIMEEAASRVDKFTYYSLSKWLEYLYSRDRYEDIISLLNRYSGFEETYPSARNIRLTCYYFLGKYKDILKDSEGIADKNIYPLIADAYIHLGMYDKAVEVIKEIKTGDTALLLSAKIDIMQGRLKSASIKASKIKSDNELLSLFFFSVSNQFNNITPEFLRSFKFRSRYNNDYVNYYIGLKYFDKKQYANAIHYFSLVGFNKSILSSAYFYQGMASLHIDINRAEWNFNKFINSGGDIDKTMIAKFMLAQIYFAKHKYDDALMLVDDCKEDYCSLLKADLYLASNQIDKAFDYVKDKKDDRSLLIKANVYYNNKKYKKALNELQSIRKPTPDSEYLLMMSLFKLGRDKDGEKIIRRNKEDLRIFSTGIQQLILAGEGRLALSYMDGLKDISPEFRLERAKLLAAYDRPQDAKKDYNQLIIDNKYIYESLTGLYEIAKKEKKGKEFVDEKLPFMEKSIEFDNKDLLVSEFAGYAFAVNSINTSIGYVNYFVDNYSKSKYYPEVLQIRGKLFNITGRYENCINDADKIIAKGGLEAEDALFMKAECMEHINKNKAVLLYKDIARNSKRFANTANSKIVDFSGNAEDVFNASENLKRVSPKSWNKGILRFIDLSNKENFNKHKDYIYALSVDAVPSVRSAALWRIGKQLFETGKHEDAALTFMKGYYLFPKEDYAVENLKGAKASYTKMGKKKEIEIIDKILVKYNIINEESSSLDKRKNANKDSKKNK